MNSVIEETLVDKITQLETKVNEQQQTHQDLLATISTMNSESENIQKVAGIVNGLREKIDNIQWPLEEVRLLTQELSSNNGLRRNPKKEKIVHEHTGSKLLWISIALGVMGLFLIMGWIQTYLILQNYRMVDACWRKLKVEANAQDVKILQGMEQRYVHNPSSFLRNLEQRELELQQRTEAKSKAIQAEDELKEWKKTAGESSVTNETRSKHTEAKTKSPSKK